MPAYKNLDEFYRYALHEFPDHFRARAHVIQKNLQDGRIFYCLRDCGVGVRYHPKDCTMNMLMAQSLMALGFWDKAEEYIQIARANLIPGQEVYIGQVLTGFQNIITDVKKKGGVVPQRIQPNEIVEISPSQIAGG